MKRSPQHLNIGAIVFPAMDQADLTGPFEVLSRIPDASFHVLAKTLNSVKDVNGFVITPEQMLADAQQMDVLVVPGGFGQEAVMDDETILEFIQQQANFARYTFSVCTGALICGAAGLLKGVKVTTHWSAFHLLEYFGAIPIKARVVIDGNHVSAAGVTAGSTEHCGSYNFFVVTRSHKRFSLRSNMLRIRRSIQVLRIRAR